MKHRFKYGKRGKEKAEIRTCFDLNLVLKNQTEISPFQPSSLYNSSETTVAKEMAEEH